MRLDKLLSNAGFGTRKDVKQLIRSGAVALRDAVVNDPGTSVSDTDAALIRVNGHPVILQHTVHLLLHKPAGYVTATRDRHLPHVLELLPEEYRYAEPFPVGRLDRDTTGLLLITNDGRLAHRLTAPRWKIEKCYRAVTEGEPFTETDIRRFADGLQLDDGLCQPAVLRILGDHTAEVVLTEGRYHQIKRMMIATGRTVTGLSRFSMGPLTLDGIPEPGDIRALTRDEVSALYRLIGLERPVL